LVQGADPPLETRIETAAQVNMNVLAAQGYAVLFPSAPTGRLGTARDPMLALPRGVLPAVDKAVELGIADSDRLFIGGLSYGGYSTYALITQTDRFKAAISMAGPVDLISAYGTFDINRRYASDAHLPHREGNWVFAWAESGQGGMGAPPWKDVARYLRNSPLFAVERVHTPLLIVYGDLDLVGMEQGEEFFSALYRQGKRAELVRYWGEGHSVETPANVRDLWARAFAWLDEFGDIARDERGALLWEGSKVQSRRGAPARTPADFLGLERFFEQKAASAPTSTSTQ
jgi:dipeptidyl aminopeptidase/acylaminoacyl peptidase